MKILCDIDDTILDLISVWLEVYNADYNDNLTKDDLTDWNIAEFVKPECGTKIFNYLDDPNLDLYYAIDPATNSLEVINALKKEKNRVIYATRLDPFQRKYKWLLKHGFLTDTRDYVLAEDKQLIKSDIMIDDRWDYINNYNGIFGILMNQPHNKKYDYPLRAYNWGDIYHYILEGTEYETDNLY